MAEAPDREPLIEHAKVEFYGGTADSEQPGYSVVNLTDQEPSVNNKSETSSESSALINDGSDQSDDEQEQVGENDDCPNYSKRQPLGTYYREKLTELNDRIYAMEQPKHPAVDWYFLTVGAIGLCVICCCWPCSICCLISALMSSNMVNKHNRVKDYISARTCSWVTLCCIAYAFVSALLSLLGLIIFIAVIAHHAPKTPPI